VRLAEGAQPLAGGHRLGVGLRERLGRRQVALGGRETIFSEKVRELV